MDERVARRYARALFGAAASAGVLQKVSEDLAELDRATVDNAELRAFLYSPLHARGNKSAALEKLFAGHHPLTLRLLALMVEKRREEHLGLVHLEYDRLFRESQGMIEAVVQSARPLPPEQRTALIAQIERQTSRRVTATEEVDPSLVGGVLVRIGESVMDGTVSGDLRRLRDRFIRELAREL